VTLVERIARTVTRHSVPVIVAVLLVSTALGAGMGMVEQSSSLDQFQSETPEAEALDYVETNFQTGPENTTTVQVIARDDNVLDRESLLAQLRFQQRLRANATVNDTLAPGSSVTGIANVLATAAIRGEQQAELAARGAALQQRSDALNATLAGLLDGVNRTRAIQHEYTLLNRSHEAGEVDNETYRDRAAALEKRFDAVVENASARLNDTETATYRGLVAQTRTNQSELDSLNASLAAGEIDEETYRSRAADVRAQFETVYGGTQALLADEFAALQADLADFQTARAAFEESVRSGDQPSLDEQVAQLESMNATEIDRVIETVLAGGGDSGGRSAFALMPTGYEPGSTTANATMLVLTQTTEGEMAPGGSASDRLVESQTAVRVIATEVLGPDNAVFGSGIIGDEIDRSMTDSLLVVGPLALLFVVLVLIIAYRDLVDILLGLFGIALVLVWTFGFMGWLGFTFNQLFVAIPVLLIGLSIDYAIHVFMRHREERERVEGVRRSMTVGLASVGVALFFVTATTVIGFLSNLISSVPPIREFGIVSAFGIVAAFVVFGALIPAMKVTLDDWLEGRGFDRRKRAFGTGGGAIGRALGVGATAARKAPAVVILLTLVVSAAGAYGAVNVDTSFQQSDFLADDPPGWMDDLPEPFAPGEYYAKDSLNYVNENFLRQDSQAQLLVEGDVTDPAVLSRVQTAQERASDMDDIVVVLSNGEADVQSPLTVMRAVAAQNESFAATFAAADTDDDGVPDRNVEAVYDHLYRVAPEQAGSVVYRAGPDDYRALRLVVSIRGGASGDRVTTEMRDLGDALAGQGVAVTATGQPIVFDLVSDQLLDTVIQSLLITLVAVFLFLMVTYRFTDGSATLGFVTLLPVAFSVTWILGTMYLVDIPFNVLTGMITSLTVGLGVAYSIHLSERYAHELERADDVWTAMRTTVTGTGGALLGSAATTVGGFGVLAFAILPPLRQFGIITGLTIVYAFLASVLVLPSLLAVWTRYLGPGMGGADGDDADGVEGDDDGDGHDSDDDDGHDSDDGHDGDGHDSDAVADDATTAETADGGAVEAAGAPTAAPSSAHREVRPGYVRSGGTFDATVALPEDLTGRVLLRETVAGADLRVAVTEPAPVQRVAAGDSIFVAWDLAPSDPAPHLGYVGTVPETAVDGDEYTIDGTVRVADGTTPVEGADTVTVVSDLFERILSNGEVTAADLRVAARRHAEGDLTRRQFERVAAEWLRRRADDDAPPDAGDGDP
jgi:predicted RND superfamily exporter protein